MKLNQLYNMDCMKGMKTFPDKYFDLAIVDPPYGIGEDGKKNHSRGKLAKPTMYKDMSMFPIETVGGLCMVDCEYTVKTAKPV